MTQKQEKTGKPLADRVSAYGGLRLDSIGKVDEAVMAGLAGVGIDDAEQIVAVAAIEGMKDHLAEQLKISRQQVDALVEHARGELHPQMLSMVQHPAPEIHGLGALEPTAEMRAEMAVMEAEPLDLEAVALPAAVNLIPRMGPIRNQGSRGTCVAFAVTASNEYYRNTGTGRIDLSEQHLYYETKLIDGHPNDCGTSQYYAVRALAARGECLESIWPYNPNPPCNNHGPLPPKARPNGLNYRLQLRSLTPKNVLMIKTALAGRLPVGVSIPVYNSWYRSAETARTGRITMRLGSEPAVGGHAICLVGYQDQASSPGGGYFILRNSWDRGWAPQCPYGAGYGTIPYQYIANDNWEAYSPTSIMTEKEEEVAEREEPGRKPRTVTITVKGDVNLVIA